jgi:hypothetical protein
MMTGTVDVKQFLEELNRARAEGRAKVEIDFNRVTLPTSPLPFESLKGRIVYIYLGLLATVIGGARLGLLASWKVVLIAAVVASIAYWAVGKRLLETRAAERIVGQLTADGDSWEKLWRFGGVTLRIADAGAEAAWIAPKDNWKDAYDRLRG